MLDRCFRLTDYRMAQQNERRENRAEWDVEAIIGKHERRKLSTLISSRALC
jgi:hypothetical protein